MPYIKVRRPRIEIPYYTATMNLYQAIHQLNPYLKHKCIDCDEQCSDCYLDYMEHIALEVILKHINKNKLKIKGRKTL